MCLKTSRKYLQLYFIIYLFIFFLQSGQKSHTTPHAGQGEKKKQKKKHEMKRMTAALYNALIKYAQIRLHTLCN